MQYVFHLQNGKHVETMEVSTYRPDYYRYRPIDKFLEEFIYVYVGY